MQKERPAVTIQNDVGNNRSGNTIVIPITHDTSTLPCVANITTQTGTDGNIILDGQANASNIMCVSKARLGDLVGTLPKSDMKRIDEAIAKTVDLMGYYSDLKQRLDDKLEYISKIKTERNLAQDELAELREGLGLSEDESLKEYIVNMKKTIDNQK
jgi:mRNA interferase MazF